MIALHPSVLLALLLGLWGCAGVAPATSGSMGSPGGIALRGFYRFEGQVEGEHVYRTRREHFTQPVRGTVEFRPDRLVLDGELGACSFDSAEVELSEEGRRVGFSCGGVGYEFGEGWGRASVPVREEWEQRGECVYWETLPDGRRGRCLDYRWLIRERRTVRSTMLVLRGPG